MSEVKSTQRNLALRAHHLLCIPQYQGSGYSKAFSRQMEEVIKTLREGKCRILLLDTPDILCCHCPNLLRGRTDRQDAAEAEKEAAAEERAQKQTEPEKRDDGKCGCKSRQCEKEAEIIRKDRTLLAGLHLETETAYEMEKLKAAVRLSMTQELFQKACGDCEWLRRGFCSYELWKEKFYDTF